MRFCYLGAHSVIFAWVLLTMDTDELGLSAQPSFRGFRKRWAANLQVDASEDPGHEVVDDFMQTSGNFSPADIFDSASLPSGWDRVSDDGSSELKLNMNLNPHLMCCQWMFFQE